MTLPAWGGVNIPELISTLAPQMSSMMDGITANLPETDTTDTTTDVPTVNPSTVLQYLIITRAEDDTMDDGTAVAVFDVSVDFEGLANDPEIQAAAEASGEDISTTYQNMDFSAAVYVGLEDNYFYGFDLSATGNMSNMGDAADAADVPPSTIEVSVYFADFNNAPTVDAPDGAEVATTEQLMSLAGMMMGGPASR